MVENWQLVQKQALSLESKIILSKKRIREFYSQLNGQVYISFSGGRDSTVLLHLVRSMYPNTEAVFLNTGLEYPEVVSFVKKQENVIHLRPKKSFYQVIQDYGYPVVGKEVAQKIYDIRNSNSAKLRDKRLYGDEKGYGMLSKKWRYLLFAPFKISSHCCNVLKKYPAKGFEKKTGKSAIVGTMASDSVLRKIEYFKTGCNSFKDRSMCRPLSFWMPEDILGYIKKFNLEISDIYSMGRETTGCVFCMFGIHMEDSSRFELMKRTHPQLYKYCMENLNMKKVMDYIKTGGDKECRKKNF